MHITYRLVGTQAGDPKEAEGISSSFFPNHSQGDQIDNREKLFVGSIKTVIGHLEGTAGLASLLKASLAVRHGVIPPNLHFNQLNPKIEPFYDRLKVPQRLEDWPKLPDGVPRRASVNSFGFGGTNAHAIVEHYDDQSTSPQSSSSSSACLGPIVLSANSETALAATITSLSTAIKTQDIDLARLAWTLQTRRTLFSYRAFFSATTTEDLITSLDTATQDKSPFSTITKASKMLTPRILGVFTGQGAQWASMGAGLYLHSASFRSTIQRLDSVLKEAPNGPSWSLADELLQKDDPTRISAAEISQPLCTALQVALVDLLKESGIHFSAVVGHSSGEIGAAYAAGIIKARDAILIAYYRGYHSHRAKKAAANPGRMMAVGMAPEDAEAFCQQPEFLGRISVAAKNSPSSITLSGDAKAIAQAQVVLDERKVFARALKVDTAYHSHHMQPVREPYLASLREAKIEPRRNCFGGKCNWYCSVYGPESGNDMELSIPLEHTYWADNMTNAVLFSHAVISAVQNEQFDLALEIGPHPALRGPATENIREVLGGTLPYFGIIQRGEDAVKSFSAALGSIWTTVDSPTPLVDFEGFRRACEGGNWVRPQVQKGLPSYPWDHDKPMLKESRRSKAWRQRSTPGHPLLGWPTPSENSREVRWRNVLRLNDVDWLHGHQFQGQVLFPAAGYLVMAIDAARHLVGKDQPVQLIELQDVVIQNGVTLDEGSLGVDLNLSIRWIEETDQGKTAEFACHSSNADAGAPEVDKAAFSGRVFVKFGLPAEDTLPSRVAPNLPMTDVSIDRFYEWTKKIDLDYSEPFMLESIKRRLDCATVTTKRIIDDDYTIHPGTLDSILQGQFAAFAYPGDGRLWTTYLPKSFRRVCLSLPSGWQAASSPSSQLIADCYLTNASARVIEGDIQVFSSDDGHAEIQAEGVLFSSLEVPTPASDKIMFYKTIWQKDIMSTFEEASEGQHTQPPTEAVRLHDLCETTALFYLSQLCKEVDQQKITPKEPHVLRFLDWARKSVRKAALPDCFTPRDKQHGSQIDLEFIHHLGSRLPSILGGSESLSHVLEEDGILNRLYTEGLGVPETNNHLEVLLGSLVHQYPRMQVLEIGAGTGRFSSAALQQIGSKLEGYTFTDTSSSSFPAVQVRLAEHASLLKCQVLDIDQSPVEQGFQAHSYDLVIAAHAFHGTKSATEAVQHCRELLRPGGFLLLLELTNTKTIRAPFTFFGKPEWWLGGEDSPNPNRTLTEPQWDDVLRENGFSGLDLALRDFENESLHSNSVMISQATDDRVNSLRDPLGQATGVPLIDNLLVIGGRAPAVSKMASRVRLFLSPFANRVTVLDSLEAVLDTNLTYGSAVLCLSGLEEATFARMSRERVSAIQSLFREAKYLLCATRGSRLEDPYANIIVGIGRSVSREMAHLRLKFADLDQLRNQKHLPEATIFSEMLLQMIHLDQPGYDGVLWSNENEVAIENGAIMIPRVMPDEDQNNALNSSRRRITQPTTPSHSTPIKMSTRDDGIILEQVEADPDDISNANQTSIQVLSSSLFRFSCSNDDHPFYFALGNTADTKRQVLAISETNGSTVSVAPDSLFECQGGESTDEVLSAILAIIVCESLLSGSTGTIWVHNADKATAEILINVAAHHRDVELLLTTSNRDSVGKATYVHPRATERELRQRVPRNLSRFVSVGTDEDSLTMFAKSLQGGKVDVQQGVIGTANVAEVISLSYDKSSLKNILEGLCSVPNSLQDVGRMTQKSVINVDQLHNQATTATSTSIVSWTDVQSLQVSVAPASTHRLFADQKTYFLVGLASDVGYSLCEWMIDHGAKYIALASRRPAVPQEVLDHFANKGATVCVFALDVSSMDSLRQVHAEITSCMPPIAGVANAALVVRDHPFDGMKFEDIEAVFGPKVAGTKNLDELFYSTPLDFFILFSSIAGIVGKPAQSNYNATCLFMSSLAAQRRKRGFAASAMHFGMLLGFGFIHGQGGPTTEARFRQDDFMAVPEPDYHEVFAQAVLSGRPDSGSGSDVVAGLGSEIDTPWRSMPRFSHCRYKGEERGTEDQGQDKKKPIKDQLAEASSSSEATSILETAVAGRLSLALGSPDEEIDASIGLVSLGLDSLVAVEVRSWLLKVLEVDVPALKFLNGSSLVDICQDVLSKLPAALTPWGVEEDDGVKMENGHLNGTSVKSRSPEPQDEMKANGAHTNGTHELEKKVSHESMNGRHVPNGTNGVNGVNGINGTNGINGHGTNGFHPSRPSSSGSTTPKYERVGDMSHAQAQLYFLHEYLQNNAHNIAYNGLFHGHLRIAKLREALWIVCKRHEALRSVYHLDVSTSRPVQAVTAEPRILLEHRSILDPREEQAEMDAVKDFKFDIEKGVVLKVAVLSHSPTLHSIIFNHHHIAIDGVSWNVFINELSQAYTGRLSATSPTSEILQSIDMAAKQVDSIKSQDIQPDLAFWTETYQTIPEPLPLFSFAKVKTRPTVQDYNIDTAHLRLPQDMTKRIERAASSVGVTPFHFYLASFATFLARCLGINDIPIGVVDANRTELNEMQTIGYFLNMLPVRIMLDQSESFHEVAKRCRDVSLAASTHQSAPFDTILDELNVSKSTAHHPLFQVAINYRKAPMNETDFGTDGKVEWDGGVPGGNPYDMFLNVVSTSDWTLLQFITQRNLYTASDGELILKWYSRALEALTLDSSCEVGRCPISSTADIAEATELGRGKDIEVPWKGTLVDRIEEVARTSSQNIAIKDDQGQTLTYDQTVARTNQIMRQLQAVSPPLAPGSRVAMLLDPVADAVCCVLAIMRLGLVWVPLDTLNHQRRLRAVVKESQPRVLVYHHGTRELAHKISDGLDATSLLAVSDTKVDGHLGEDLMAGPQSTVERLRQPAMIIYTSGSTGLPKGVVLTHEGLTNQIFGTTATLDLGSDTTTLQQSPLGFDLMIDQIFLALCNGGTVAIVGKSGRGDPTHIAELMVKHRVSLTHFVPSEYLALLNYGHHILANASSWRYAMSGGEKLSKVTRKAFQKLDLENLNLVNVYGPAEISVACAKGLVPYRETVEISSDYLLTSPNYDLQITDSEMKPLPVGFPGEICISGRGVGLGYLDRPEETSRKFVETTSAASSLPIRTYRSGDKGRILADGTLNVLGRLDGDSQVKIHGFRVELNEIANALVQISNDTIVHAAASWRPAEQSGVLIAFVVFDAGYTGDKSAFIKWLQSNFPLPPVMKPTYIVATDRIPGTANGKIDQAAVDALPLPVPEAAESSVNGAVTEKLSPGEESMKDVWEEVLSTRNIGSKQQDLIQPSSDFFQVGGNSILMIKLKSLVETQLGVKVSMPELFHASTLSSMTTLIENASSSTQEATDVTRKSFFTPAQGQQTMNWDLEMATMVDGLPQPKPLSSSPNQKRVNGHGGLIVVLTGATGFIGEHLLSSLVQDPSIAQVHCIAIRPDAAGNARHVATKSGKIVEYSGELSSLSLGLSDSQFKWLADHAHAIIHNGAEVSLLKTYQTLRRANVVSTRTLCEMAIPRRIPVHFVSTASVAKVMQLNDGEPLLEVVPSPAVPELLNAVDGYAATKWASETLLENLAVSNGLSGYVHRLAHVMGENASELDAVGMLTKYSVELRALPRINQEDVDGVWDFIEVEDVVRDMIQSVIDSTVGLDSTEPRLRQIPHAVFINHCSRLKVEHANLKTYLEDMAGGPLREMEMKDWLEEAQAKGMHPLVYEFFTVFNEGRGKMVLPVIAKG